METVNRRALNRATIALVAASLMLASVLALAPRSQAAKAEVTDIFLFIDDYTNDSIVDAWAALNFSETPIPPPSQVDDILFEWFAPNGTEPFQRLVDPNDAAWAPCSFRVDAIGTWTVNATYTTNASVHESLAFQVLPSLWGPGQFHLGHTTVVGRTGALTIRPGTNVFFPAGGAMQVRGKLTAEGSGSLPIIFSSGAGSPAPGDWNVISFLDTADNSSLVANASVRFSTRGIRVESVSPTIRNVGFIDNQVENVRLESSHSILRDITITGGQYGIELSDSPIALMTATITNADYGLVFEGPGGTASDVRVTNSAQVGVHFYNSTAAISSSVISDSLVGIRADDSAVQGENITVSRGDTAVRAALGSTVSLRNSILSDLNLYHYSLSDGSTVLARNVTLNPSSPLRRNIKDTSLLTVQNYLWIKTESYDTNTSLQGVTIDIRQSGGPWLLFTTGPSGLIGPIVVNQGVYGATDYSRNNVLVSASRSGFLFANASRHVDMGTSHVELFRGSVHDLDHDKNPDFNDSDIDGDGLTNRQEATLHTDPLNPDTDGDGMPDGWEVAHGFDPLDLSDALGDKDGDGLTNLQEYQHGTDPSDPDTDGDGMPDGWEVANGLNPLNPADANIDSDGDGFTNLEEYQNATNPKDWGSHPPLHFNLGPIGIGDFWYILLVPLGGLCLVTVMISMAWITAVPRRKRSKRRVAKPPK